MYGFSDDRLFSYLVEINFPINFCQVTKFTPMAIGRNIVVFTLSWLSVALWSLTATERNAPLSRVSKDGV